jgi:hypothetical protein
MIHLFTFTWAAERRSRWSPQAPFVYLEKPAGRAGLVLNWRAAWVGAHWGSHNRRLCVNLLPFVTLWITLPGGQEP